MNSYSDIIYLQNAFASKVIVEDVHEKVVEHICGIDVSYRNNYAYCSAAIIKKKNLEPVEYVNNKTLVKFPYIPTLFILREAEPILSTLKLLRNHFDLLLIDGHGLLHPRNFGLACYCGIIVNKATIGVAKRLLCGEIRRDHFVQLNGSVCGYMINNTDKKPIFISVGHKISLKNSIELVKELIKHGQGIPEPLRIADKRSKTFSKFFDSIALKNINRDPYQCSKN